MVESTTTEIRKAEVEGGLERNNSVWDLLRLQYIANTPMEVANKLSEIQQKSRVK